MFKNHGPGHINVQYKSECAIHIRKALPNVMKRMKNQFSVFSDFEF